LSFEKLLRPPVTLILKKLIVPEKTPFCGGILPPYVYELQDLGVARLSIGSGLMKIT